MRTWGLVAIACSAVAGCASAGATDPSQQGAADAQMIDVPPDACPDTDNNNTCNNVDKCPMHDDRVDSDSDTIADGCDKCPGKDDRIDVNANGVPDCTELQLRTIDVKLVNGNYWRGWQSSGVASHASSNDNTITGVTGGITYNSYFVFPLAGFTASTITSVKLELELESYGTADANETYSMWDVTTPATTVETTAQLTSIFNDLGTGMTYGTQQVTAASVGTTLSTQLNAQASTDLKAALGADFVIGIKLDTVPGYIRYSAAQEARIARLVVQYLP